MFYPLIYGEILFDQFEDGSRVLGGAPFNVAWHLQGLGLGPLMVSAIGTDSLADEVLASTGKWGMQTGYIQRHAEYPTGTVRVELKNGQPAFEIVNHVAYDEIAQENVLNYIKQSVPDILYHGSLAARSNTSRNTLHAIKEHCHCSVFVDINLRPPWWNPALIKELLQGATWLKLNDDELTILCNEMNIVTDDLESKINYLLEKYGLKAVIVTLGEKGSVIQNRDNCYHSNPVQVDNIVDTVGAGDGFSAVAIMGLLNDWDLPVLLERANRFAARICEQRGAICQDIDFYKDFLRQWN